MSTTDAQINEIFTSIQGEGLYVGERQVFLRFSGCNLSCDYCDSQSALQISKEYRVEQTPGTKDCKNMQNPASLNDLEKIILGFFSQKNLFHSLSLTGGEPLLQVDFLKNFLPKIKSSGIIVYLETNGTLPNHLLEIIDLVDIISMDIKIPSASLSDFNKKDNLSFLEISKLKEVFVKVVVVPDTTVKEIDDVSLIISQVDDKIPLIIQPATPSSKIKHRPSAEKLLSWHAVAKRRLKNVRVIPQVHKVLGVI